MINLTFQFCTDLVTYMYSPLKISLTMFLTWVVDWLLKLLSSSEMKSLENSCKNKVIVTRQLKNNMLQEVLTIRAVAWFVGVRGKILPRTPTTNHPICKTGF